MIIKQISTFMENTTGRLADITGLLAKAGINLRAISIADTADFGILRMVADQPDEAVRLLKEAGFTSRETDVIGVEVPDHPGELARIMALFRDQGVSIEYPIPLHLARTQGRQGSNRAQGRRYQRRTGDAGETRVRDDSIVLVPTSIAVRRRRDQAGPFFCVTPVPRGRLADKPIRKFVLS